MDESRIIATGHRERTYRFCAGLCLKPPSDLMIGMIKDETILSVFQGDDVDDTAFRTLAEFVRQADGIPNLKEELEAEHTSLFVLPSGVIPHEAVYLDREMRLGGRVTAGVKQYYDEAGATVLESCSEMPDHIGMELEFMGFLCSMEKQLWQSSDRKLLHKCIALQKDFLQDHLSRWGYDCCRDVIEHATYGFYKALMYFVMQFLRNEEEYVSSLYTDAGAHG